MDWNHLYLTAFLLVCIFSCKNGSQALHDNRDLTIILNSQIITMENHEDDFECVVIDGDEIIFLGDTQNACKIGENLV